MSIFETINLTGGHETSRPLVDATQETVRARLDEVGRAVRHVSGLIDKLHTTSEVVAIDSPAVHSSVEDLKPNNEVAEQEADQMSTIRSSLNDIYYNNNDDDDDDEYGLAA